ncbi:MAG TPA: NeuD/PglB/VioB family sugar acetyltransferase [Nitrosopumilaceae archaeon]|nr:NeuD/PglB/VioB family sugar acetyltransferase [Nitrosopumilaceae archaeon]
MKTPIVLIGGGGHCHSVIDVIESGNSFSIAGIIDKKEKVGQFVLGYKVIGTDEDLVLIIKEFRHFHISMGFVGKLSNRVKLFELLKTFDVDLPVIIASTAYVSKYSTIEMGTIIMHHALVNANARIGKNCIINSKALIEHDAIIENHCHIATGSIINGGVHVGEESFIGSNAVTKQDISIPSRSFIKANAIVK